MFMIVKVPAEDTSAKIADMKELLAPRPAGHNASSENVKDDSRDIFVTVNSDRVSPQTMHEIAKLIAVLSDTDRDIHLNVI